MHSSPYRKAVRAEQVAFETFCAASDLPPESSTAVVLYLTMQMSKGQSGQRVRSRLGHLDAFRRSAGRSPWSADPVVLDLMAGVYRRARLPTPSVPDPLFLENVRSLIDVIDRPTAAQVRDKALLVVRHSSGLDVQQLHELGWANVRIKPSTVLIDLKLARGVSRVLTLPSTGDAACPVDALRDLHRIQVDPLGPLFGRLHVVHLRRILHGRRSPPSGGGPVGDRAREELAGAIQDVMRPRPRQLRNRALLLLTFSAYLRSGEVCSLRRDDLNLQDEGLVVSVPGRQGRILGFRPHSDRRYCPVQAWRAWSEVPAVTTILQPAFPELLGQTPQKGAVGPDALSRLLAKAVREAGLSGRYNFDSLRIGAIRSAFRSGAPLHVVAREAGLRDMATIVRHMQRQELLTSNVAAELGL